MPPKYETSLSDAAWEAIENLFSSKSKRGRTRIHDVRLIVDAILYVVKNGCVWRCLPNDFPTWKTVYHYFRTWSNSNLWHVLNDTLVSIARLAAEKESSPSLMSMDSQSQTAEPGVEKRGLDGGKKVNGRKRHIAVDTLGLVHECVCTAANVADSVAGQKLAVCLNNKQYYPRLKKILGDNTYKYVGSDLRISVTVESAERKERQKGFVPEAFRWAVERTFAWLNRQRRLVRNYEKKIRHQESMNYIANIRLCLKRYETWLAASL